MDIDSFVDEYRKMKSPNYPFDKLIYEFIKNNNDHVNEDIVYSKVVLVNRMYRANLRFAGGNPEEKIAKCFVEESVDEIMQKVSGIKFNSESLEVVVATHKAVMDLCEKRIDKKLVSFVSKYMHFHFPDAIPIYDKYAYNSAWDIVKNEKQEKEIKEKIKEVGNDGDFTWFCSSLTYIQDKVLEKREKFHLKRVDRVLYGN